MSKRTFDVAFLGDNVRVKANGAVGCVTQSNGHAIKANGVWLHTSGVEVVAPGKCPTMALILMGVCGSGKTTIGQELSAQLHWKFLDADDFHPPENVEKMRRGEPLNDDDRRPWLQILAAEISESISKGVSAVVTCSALKESYRDVLTSGKPHIYFVHLNGSPALIAQRLASRQHEYMNPKLMSSQFASLEPPSSEHALIIDVVDGPSAIVQQICTHFALR